MFRFLVVPLLFRVFVRLRAGTGQSFVVGLVLRKMLWHSTLSRIWADSRVLDSCTSQSAGTLVGTGVCDLVNARYSTQALSPAVSRKRYCVDTTELDGRGIIYLIEAALHNENSPGLGAEGFRWQ